MLRFGQRVAQWFDDRKLTENSNSAKQMRKLLEEVGELAGAIANQDKKELKDAIGDCAVVLAGMARMEGMLFEECCDHAWEQIKNRKGYLREDGVFVKEADIEG